MFQEEEHQHQLSEIHRLLQLLNEKVGQVMTAQDDITAAVGALQGFLTDLSNDVQAIAAKIDNGETVDTSALTALVAQLPAAQAALDALAAPPVTGTPGGPTPPVTDPPVTAGPTDPAGPTVGGTQ